MFPCLLVLCYSACPSGDPCHSWLLDVLSLLKLLSFWAFFSLTSLEIYLPTDSAARMMHAVENVNNYCECYQVGQISSPQTNY